MATISIVVKLKQPTKRKHSLWQAQQQEYARCINWCVQQIQNKVKLSSSNVTHNLKSVIKNEAIRRAKKAISDHKSGLAQSITVFKSNLPISINNQNWGTLQKNGHWYIGFTTNEGKVYVPVVESDDVHTYFPFFVGGAKHYNLQFRGTIQLFRKGRDWYIAIPIEVSSELEGFTPTPKTEIGVDLGLRHIAVVSEPKSGKRQFFSGKEVGYVRRHFRSLRRSLGQKKALRAIRRIGQKEQRWMTDFNRKLANSIVHFALQFDQPVIKMEKLDRIRQNCKSTKRADRTIHSWAFYQLQQFIIEKATRCGVVVLFIEPAYTSQRCFKCGHVEKGNRSKDRFRCKKCNHHTHADLNAGSNIAISTSLVA